MKKILIIGSGGAGKSVFARQLGAILNIPVFHLDAYFWKPHWNPTPREEWIEILVDLMQKDQWILDGNYQSTLEMRFQKADTIFFLDFSRFFCLWRVLKRHVLYRNQSRPDMGEGCPEKIDSEFLRWIWNFPKNQKPEIYVLCKTFTEGRMIRVFHYPSQMKQYLREISFGLKKE